MATLSNVHELEIEIAPPEPRGTKSAPRAFEIGAFVREHTPFVSRSLRRLGVPAVDVEDAVQEVFVVVFRKLDTIAVGAERSFLYGTAMRIASNARRVDRRAQTHRSGEPLAPEQAEIDASPTAEELIDRREARAALDSVLETMSVEMRAVFTLFELEEMTTNEIAELLQIPPGTVSSRLRRAREHFEEQVRLLQAKHEREGLRP